MKKLVLLTLMLILPYIAFANHEGAEPTLTASVELIVNDEVLSAGCVNFVKNFFDSTICGMLKPLHGVDKIESLDIQIDNNDELGIVIILNRQLLPMNLFVKKIIKNVIITMLNTLDDMPVIRNARITIAHP